MAFCQQLKLLLWKNLLIRSRQKGRCIAELLWPLFLFIILAAIRRTEPKKNLPECHFNQMALPTAGGIPFFQSAFCTLENSCYNTEGEAEISRRTMKDSPLKKLLESLQRFSTVGSQMDIQNTLMDTGQLTQLLGNMSNDIKGGIILGHAINNTDRFRKTLESKNISLSEEAVDALLSSEFAFQALSAKELWAFRNNASSILCQETLLQKFIINNMANGTSLYSELCNLTPEEAEDLFAILIRETDSKVVYRQAFSLMERNSWQSFSLSDMVKIEGLTNRMRSNLNRIRSFSYILDDAVAVADQYQMLSAKMGDNDSDIAKFMKVIEEMLCSRNSTEEDSRLLGQPTRFEYINEQLQRKQSAGTYKNDSTLSPECNKLFKNLEEGNTTVAVMWTYYKPFIRGKILYTPMTNATRRIMENINSTIYRIKEVADIINGSLHNFPVMRDTLIENKISLEVMRKFISSELGRDLLRDPAVKKSLNIQTDDDLNRTITFLNRYLADDNALNRSRSYIDRLALLKNVIKYVDCIDFNRMRPYNSEEEAMKDGMKLMEKNELFAVVVFEDQKSENLSQFVTYKIRMSTDRVDSTDSIRDRYIRWGPRRRPFIDMKYFNFGFAYLQDLLEHYIIVEQTGAKPDDLPGMYTQQFPYPCYLEDRFVLAVAGLFAMFMVLSWVYTCAMIVKSIVYEKEQRLKETMQIMGLSNGIHWISWFIDSIVPITITVVLLTLLLGFGEILGNANPVLLFLLIMVYSLSNIALSFLISVFFSKANLAAAAGGIIFFILYLPYPMLIRWRSVMPAYGKAFICLSPNVALGLASYYVALYEVEGGGLQWSNVGSSPLYGDNFNLSYIIYMMLFDAGLFFLLTWYIEAVFPGMYGIPKPWNFPFTSSYWCGTATVKSDGDSLKTGFIINENFEADPNLPLGITIQNLSKAYSNGKVAVNGLSLNFYQGQITSFLGHNGAGKTTTISILTGLIPPTSGTAKIYGMDIRTDLHIIRDSLGVCPQHNILFDLLTVEEHLWFYARLRGRPVDKVLEESDRMINDLGLQHKRSSNSSTLSGGMKRKLSVAIAFIGNPKTVILDEPTSGVDPYSRRSIWKLLIKYKKGRTLLLTTHHMDEADILGDRVAIIADGRLQCCGSSLFLKNRFGSGYYLTVDVREDAMTMGSESSQIEKISSSVREIAPTARLYDHIGTELIFILPQRNMEELKLLVDYLEENRSELDINSYGISDTTLEEIFLRVTSQPRDEPPADKVSMDSSCGGSRLTKLFNLKRTLERRKAVTSKISDANGEPEFDSVVQVNGSIFKYSSVPVTEDGEVLQKESRGNKYWRQFHSLNIKRYHHNRRNIKAVFTELFLPAIFILLMESMMNIVPSLYQPLPLPLVPSLYGWGHTFTSINVTVDEKEWQRNYVKSMEGPSSFGIDCVNKSKDDESWKFCQAGAFHNVSGSINVSVFGPECSCSTGSHLCPSEAGKPDPPSEMLANKITLFDLSGSNVSDWLLKTDYRYRESRVGGYTFGTEAPFPNIKFYNNIPIVSYKSRNLKIWFNNKAWASSVAYLSAINNVILRSSLPPEKHEEEGHYGILAINHPMNYTDKQMNHQMDNKSGYSLLQAVSVLFAMGVVSASFTLYLIEERVSNSKHLQLVSGVNRTIYWLQAYLWDMSCYLLAATLCVIIFFVFNDLSYISSRNVWGLIILLVLYGWSVIPLMYPVSFLFSVPSFAFVGLACTNIFIGMVTTMTTYVLGSLDDKDLEEVNDVLKEVFLIFPHFCLGDGLLKLATNYYEYSVLELFLKHPYVENRIFQWNMLGKNLLIMFIEGWLYLLLTLIIEYKRIPFFNEKNTKTVSVNAEDNHSEDSDVKAERERVNQNKTENDILVINNLTKVYRKKRAVNEICVGIKKGECFGLLGLNGAGKTTTFKILTGDLKPTSGDGFLNGYSISRQVDSVRSHFGYCPQFDALDPLLTPREHLQFYGLLRNIPDHQLQSVVETCLLKLDLKAFADRCAGTLSGGNKRKLSTAIAILDDPSVIFLDEPTSGMDPQSRRFLWSCVQSLVKDGRCVILTSHSMEECQALCSRLTIMVNGEFKCLGSSQHLKTKFGGGYSLILRCPDTEGSVDKLKQYVSSNLPQASLEEEHFTRLHYQLPKNSHMLQEVFHVMEDGMRQSIVLDCSLSQTTLEDVFIQFASQQGEAKDSKRMRFMPAVCRRCCGGE